MKITLIGFDVELSGKHVISVGLSSLNNLGEYTQDIYVMHGIRPPMNTHGESLLTGQQGAPIDSYGSFTKEKWEWWSQHLNVLRSQLSQPPLGQNNTDVWKAIRRRFDELTQRTVAHGGCVRVVSDNPAVDCGVVSEHMKKAHGGDWSFAVDYLQRRPGGPREHSFIADVRTPKWQRNPKVGILFYRPIRLKGIRLVKHYPPHDALLALCEYMGYIMAYPSVGV